jgi:hypothetical protein
MKTVIILFMILAAQAIPAQDLAGNYVLHGVMEVGSELTLKPGGSFEFMLAYGAADYWAKGTWRHEAGDVILQSSGKEQKPFRLLRSEAGKPGRIRVCVIGQNGKGVENIHVDLAADKHYQANTDADGAAVFPDAAKAHAVSFEVLVYSLEAGPFEIDSAHKDFYFAINGDAISQVLFKDEHLAIDGASLIMKHWGEDHPMRYEKE